MVAALRPPTYIYIMVRPRLGNKGDEDKGRIGQVIGLLKRYPLERAPPETSAGRLGNKDDQEKGRFDKVITVEAFEDLTKDKVSKGKKRKAEALEDVSQEKKNARANEAAETAMMAAAERDCLFLHKRSAIQVMIDMWRPGDDCFWC